MRQNKYNIYLPLLFALVLITGIYMGVKIIKAGQGTKNRIFTLKPHHDKLYDVVQFIEQDYVDSVSSIELKETAIKAMLKTLDPHSRYFSAEEIKAENERLVGNFEGIGIEFRVIDDTIVVMHVIPGGPSEKIGLRSGDRIVGIEDELVAGVNISNAEVVKKLKGERRTKVKVSVLRSKVKKTLDFIITRDIIPLYSVDVSYMVDDKIGYIKLSKFSATTPDEFDEAIAILKERGMQKLIVDLRGNTGGYLKSAIDLADEFLRNNELIVYTEGINRPRQFAYATKKGRFENEEVVFLIDEGSASASEIVAGAIQDNDRGLIIGRRSFGKGLVQEQLDLFDGSAIRLTVSRYYTPTGRCIQKSYENGAEDYHEEYFRRFVNGEVEHPDSIKFADSLKYITSGGKVVYGGGGIMPDVYVPLRSGKEYVYYNKLINNGLIYRFAFQYTDRQRSDLERKYAVVDDYIKDFFINEQLFRDFVRFAEEDGIEPDKPGIKTSEEKIKILLKAFIGRNIHNDKAFYPIYNDSDSIFVKAYQQLSLR